MAYRDADHACDAHEGRQRRYSPEMAEGVPTDGNAATGDEKKSADGLGGTRAGGSPSDRRGDGDQGEGSEDPGSTWNQGIWWSLVIRRTRDQ